MNPLGLYILDDEPAAVQRLTSLLEAFSGVRILGCSSNAVQALKQITALRPDVILMDVCMRQLSGLDLPRRLPAGYAPALIYVTAFETFAVQAFELGATDYLVKPATTDRLGRALDRARDHARLTADSKDERGGPPEWGLASHLWVPARKGRQRIALSQIDRLEAEREYVRIHCSDHSYLVRHSLASMADQLAGAGFIRVHRSMAVNAAHVKGLQKKPWGGAALQMTSGVEAPVGPSYVAAVRAALGLDWLYRHGGDLQPRSAA